MTRALSVPLFAAGALLLLACTSPEDRRVRGQGAGTGADTDNRDAIVEMHEGSYQFHRTPCLMPEEECTGPLQASGLPEEYPDHKGKR